MSRCRTGRVIAAAALAVFAALPAAAAPQSIAIPAYFYPVYPDPLWKQMEDAVPAVSFAVMNPASGPGGAPDSNYTSQIAHTRAAGVRIIGYVTSSYATRTLADIEDEIDSYYLWYPVDGIFIDEADNNCVNASYYASLDTYVKTKGGLGLTVINPGTVAPECFVTSADVILNFEGSYSQYQSWMPLGWESGYDASHFWHLVYATAEADMPAAVLLSQSRGAGYVYVTPDVLSPNPWDSLPGEPYWSDEISYVQPASGGCPATLVKPKLQIKGIDTVEADDTLKFSGIFTLAGTPAIDPLSGGLRFVLGDGGGTFLDVSLPAGAYGGDPGSGWIVGNGKWTWRDDSDAPASGIAKALVKVKSDGISTRVSFKIGGVDGPFAVDSGELPLSGALLLDTDDPTALCGDVAFAAAGCEITGGGSGVRCK